jgi:hypothetical protein
VLSTAATFFAAVFGFIIHSSPTLPDAKLEALCRFTTVVV